jgi:gliding motility associated protien GldN
MKKKIFLQFLLIFLFASPLFAQQPAPPPTQTQPQQQQIKRKPMVLDGVYVKENIQEREAMPYPYLREADVMWSKQIWRIIDLKEKINQPLGQPASGSTADRRSLIDVLMDALQDGAITAYSFVDDQWTTPMTEKEIEAQGGARVDTQQLTHSEPPYDTYDTVIAVNFNRDNVIDYRIKEVWFFDKQRSVMDVRIVGIGPEVYARDQNGEVRADGSKKLLCWFYYPEIRKVLHTAETFNRQNDAERKSFEDIFEKRMFNSYIYKEANVYDRKISDYKEGIAILYEGEKIKNEIVDLEQEMWEW